MPHPDGALLKGGVRVHPEDRTKRLLTVHDGTTSAEIEVPGGLTPFEKLELVRNADAPIRQLTPTQVLMFLSDTPPTVATGAAEHEGA